MIYRLEPNVLRVPVTRIYARSLSIRLENGKLSIKVDVLNSSPFPCVFFTGRVNPMTSLHTSRTIINPVDAIRCLHLDGSNLPDDCYLRSEMSGDLTGFRLESHAWPISASSTIHSASVWACVALMSCAMVRGLME